MSAEPNEGGGDTGVVLSCPVCYEGEHHVIDCPRLEDGSLLAFWRASGNVPAEDPAVGPGAYPVGAASDCRFCFGAPSKPGSFLCAGCVAFFECHLGRPLAAQDAADLSDPVFDPPRPFYETIRPAACGPFVPQPGDSVAIEPSCEVHPPSREWDGLCDCGPSLFGRMAVLRDNVVDRLTPPWHRRGLHSRRSGRGSLRAVRKRWLGTLGHALRVRGVKP
jgi:hypothetical protein